MLYTWNFHNTVNQLYSIKNKQTNNTNRGLPWWRRKWQPTPVFLPRKSHGRRNPIGYSPWGRKELDTTEWLFTSLHFTSLPGWLSGKESACQFRRHEFDPWIKRILRRWKWQPTLVLLSVKSHGQGSLAGYRLWGRKRVRCDWAAKQQFFNVCVPSCKGYRPPQPIHEQLNCFLFFPLIDIFVHLSAQCWIKADACFTF